MADKYIKKGSLSVSTDLELFLKSEVLPGLDLSDEHFWTSLEKIINEFSPRNKELLEIRESMQEQIDAWHLANPGQEKNLDGKYVFGAKAECQFSIKILNKLK